MTSGRGNPAKRSAWLRPALLLAVTAAAAFVVFRLPAIPQDPAFHRFADARPLWGIPSFGNVFSNLAFLIVGPLGLARLRSAGDRTTEKGAWIVFFLGIMLTAFGSAYYHWAPSNATLVWDRLPLSLGFMGFLAGVLGEWISPRLGRLLLWPLVGVGAASVLYWYAGEVRGHGDLRPYVLVQFLPLLMIPLIMALYRSPTTHGRYIFFALVWYGLAKVFELFDRQIFSSLGFVSGHTLKHLAAAAGCWTLVSMLGIRAPLQDQG